MSKQQQLDRIEQDIKNQNICSELAAGATQLVMGDGSLDAKLMFIGEAPGAQEDKQGKPFVGAAGKFLNKMLQSINLNREDVYITNIVKYRPPANRDPLPEEKAQFMPFLTRQIEAIKPDLIVTLGRHSTNAFLPDVRIGEAHGQPKRKRFNIEKTPGGERADELQGDAEARTDTDRASEDGALEASTQQIAAKLGGVTDGVSKQSQLAFVILPLYHPAAALYNGGMRTVLLEDFARIPKILELIEKDKAKA